MADLVQGQAMIDCNTAILQYDKGGKSMEQIYIDKTFLIISSNPNWFPLVPGAGCTVPGGRRAWV